ncbi:MAG: hypothetical protein HYZ50_07395 [Deltaproteobacteria bacterium]|nr:hypothetical protein [Deltaproteobacteria bacterium]
MQRFFRLIASFFLAAVFSSFAVAQAVGFPLRAAPAVKQDESPALREIPPQEVQSTGLRTIPVGKRPVVAELDTTPPLLSSRSPALVPLATMPPLVLNFEGVPNVNAVLPPDTNGDVGPDHYVQWVNLSFAIYDKSGQILYGPVPGNTLWSGFGGPCEDTNDGDPHVLYDHLADRWLFSQPAVPNFPAGPFYQCLAVSKTPDPTGAYHRYAFLISNTKLNDYPKFGVWPDGYYMSINQFTGLGTPAAAYAGAAVVAFERAKMLTGKSAQALYLDLESVNPNFGGMLPADLDGPPPPDDTPNYFAEVDDTIFGFPTDSLRIWEFHVDWTNLANSTFGLSGNPNVVLDVDPFDANLCNFSSNCIPQKRVSRRLDALSDRLMFRLQYRNFGTHQTLVANHTVDVAINQAGIRWYELRNSGGGWSIHQQGTYAPDAAHRWMGSAAMDKNGNLAIGFSASNRKKFFPSIHYAGRLASDPLGELAQGEAVLKTGGGAQTHSASRWGDYSSLTVDPVDDCTFWYTSEYHPTTSVKSWHTRVGAFRFADCSGGPNSHDLALTKILPPRKAKLNNPARVQVEIQNRSPHAETIDSEAVVQNLVPLSLTSLGACAAPTPTLHVGPPQKSFPLTLKSKGKLRIVFDVTFTCANNPSNGSPDYSYTASVDHAALDGNADNHTADDTCPRSVTPPFVIDPNPDGSIKDSGCGGRKPDGTFGTTVTTDVVGP